jgi:hypothetical protein
MKAAIIKPMTANDRICATVITPSAAGNVARTAAITRTRISLPPEPFAPERHDRHGRRAGFAADRTPLAHQSGRGHDRPCSRLSGRDRPHVRWAQAITTIIDNAALGPVPGWAVIVLVAALYALFVFACVHRRKRADDDEVHV